MLWGSGSPSPPGVRPPPPLWLWWWVKAKAYDQGKFVQSVLLGVIRVSFLENTSLPMGGCHSMANWAQGPLALGPGPKANAHDQGTSVSCF